MIITNKEFETLFKTEKVDGLWYCYGGCNGTNFSHEARTEDDCKIEMWQVLAGLGFIETSDDYKPGGRFQLLSTSVVNRKINKTTGGGQYVEV